MRTKTIKRMTAIVIALAVAFTFMPTLENANAAKKPGKVTVRTSKKKPGKVKGLKVVKKGKKFVVLKWRKAKRAKKYIVYKKRIRTKFKKVMVKLPNGEPLVEMDYDTGKERYVYEMKSVQVGKYRKAKTTKKTKVRIKKLKRGASYKFKVVAKNKAGKGKPSKQRKTTTKRGKLTKKEQKQIELLTVTDFMTISRGRISYKWNNKYSVKRSGITHYELWYKKKGSSKWEYKNVTVTDPPKNKSTGHQNGWPVSVPKGEYYAKMRACKGNIKGPFTETVEHKINF